MIVVRDELESSCAAEFKAILTTGVELSGFLVIALFILIPRRNRPSVQFDIISFREDYETDV